MKKSANVIAIALGVVKRQYIPSAAVFYVLKHLGMMSNMNGGSKAGKEMEMKKM